MVDVLAETLFSCGLGGGEKLFDPQGSGRKGLDFRRKIRPKKLKCFFLDMCLLFSESSCQQEQASAFLCWILTSGAKGSFWAS